MIPRTIHYAARRLVGKHVIGTQRALCGTTGRNPALDGHQSLVTCIRCRRLLKTGRSFVDADKPATYSEAWSAALTRAKGE